jgi:hypothetical protein
MLWLDNDHEGENISEEVEWLCTTANPQLQVRFSMLSAGAFESRSDQPPRLARARPPHQQCIHALPAIPRDPYTVINSRRSASSSTRPNFVPERFWLLGCSLRRGDCTCDLKWCRKRLFCKLSCFAI